MSRSLGTLVCCCHPLIDKPEQANLWLNKDSTSEKMESQRHCRDSLGHFQGGVQGEGVKGPNETCGQRASKFGPPPDPFSDDPLFPWSQKGFLKHKLVQQTSQKGRQSKECGTATGKSYPQDGAQLFPSLFIALALPLHEGLLSDCYRPSHVDIATAMEEAFNNVATHRFVCLFVLTLCSFHSSHEHTT